MRGRALYLVPHNRRVRCTHSTSAHFPPRLDTSIISFHLSFQKKCARYGRVRVIKDPHSVLISQWETPEMVSFNRDNPWRSNGILKKYCIRSIRKYFFNHTLVLRKIILFLIPGKSFPTLNLNDLSLFLFVRTFNIHVYYRQNSSDRLRMRFLSVRIYSVSYLLAIKF